MCADGLPARPRAGCQLCGGCGAEGAMNSTVGLEFKDWLSSHWKVAACRVLQHGGPGGAPAVGLPRGHGEPGAGEAAPTVRSRARFSGWQSLPDCKFPALRKMSRLFFSFLGKFGVFELATCGGAGGEGWRLSRQVSLPLGHPTLIPAVEVFSRLPSRQTSFMSPFVGGGAQSGKLSSLVPRRYTVWGG